MFQLHINHAHQRQLATATPENHFFPYTNLHFCDVYCLVPNFRYRPNIRQLFLAEYSFSAETRKSVFGRSLVAVAPAEDDDGRIKVPKRNIQRR
jgi:hypothetical protein